MTEPHLRQALRSTLFDLEQGPFPLTSPQVRLEIREAVVIYHYDDGVLEVSFSLSSAGDTRLMEVHSIAISSGH